jgi:hypothetical protein
MKKLSVALLAVALLLLGVLVALLAPRHCPVTRSAFEQIEAGMPLAQAQAILGGPPGDYSTEPTEPVSERQSVERLRRDFGAPGLCWDGNEGSVWLLLDSRGRVEVCEFVPRKQTNAGLLERLGHRLGLGR